MVKMKIRESVSVAIPPSIILFLCLIVVEVPIAASIKATVAIAIQSHVGSAIYRNLTHPRRPSDLENIVLGFSLGVALSTFCDMALRSTTGFQFGWILPAVVIFFTSKLRLAKPMTEPLHKSSRLQGSVLIPIATIAFLYMAQDALWPLRVFAGGVCIWMAITFLQDARWTAARWILNVAGTVSICSSFFNRSPFWWYITDDFRVFESLSISITKFGPSNPMGALGTLGSEYHFMTYAFSGMIDAIINAPTFLVLSHLMPMLTSLLLSAVIWMFIEREGGSRKLPNFFLATMFPLFFDYSFTSPSYCFGLFFYFVSIYFWTDHRDSMNPMWRIPINIVLAIFVVTTKVSNLPTVLLGLACVAGYGLIRHKEWAMISFINFLSTSATISVYFALFLANSRSGSQLSSSYVFGFAQRIAGDISTVDDRPTRVLVGLLVTSIFLVLPLLGAVLFAAHNWTYSTMLCLIVFPAIPLVIISALFGGHAASGYFVLSSLNILNIALIVSVSHYVEHSSFFVLSRKRLSILILAIVASTYMIQALQITYNGGGQNLILVRSILAAHWLPSLFIVIIWFVFQNNVRKNIRHLFLFAVITAEITFFATISFQTMTDLTKGPELTQSEASVAIGTPDQIDVGIWIRKHLPENVILASNYFCENACRGADWFENDFKLLDTTFNFPPSPNGYGSFDMILPLYAERRFLIQGSRFLLVNGMDRNEIRQRMSATLQFANNPNNETLSIIEKYGVTYFVIDQRATDQKTWGPNAIEIYRNNTFIVLELNSL